MRDEGVTQVELAKRIGRDQKGVRRLLDFDHRSHIGQVEDALEQLGRRLVISVEKAACAQNVVTVRHHNQGPGAVTPRP